MSDKSTVDKLDHAIDEVLRRGKSSMSASDPEVAELAKLALELRTLPDAAFKEQLRASLVEGVPADSSTASVRLALQQKTSEPDILPTLFGAGQGLYPIHRSSFLASVVVHAVTAVFLLSAGIWVAEHREKIPLVSVALVNETTPYVLPVAPDTSGGGGGGGEADKLRASKGNPPRFARDQITPPAVVVRNEAPKLSGEPTVVGPPNLTFPQTQLGDPMSNILGPPSSGIGTGGGVGSGSGGGVGSGTGPGVGPGRGGGIGGGLYRVGGGVSAPRAIYDPEPEYSEEARKAKYQGTVILQVVVGPDGRTSNVRLMRSLGMGLDEKAMDAVRNWRFEPALKDGHAVAVLVSIEVNFRLY